MIFYALFALLIALNLADVVLTQRILAAGGRELNPIMAALMRKLGIMPAMIVSKVLMLLIVWHYLADSTVLLLLICLLYAGIVWHNWRQRQ